MKSFKRKFCIVLVLGQNSFFLLATTDAKSEEGGFKTRPFFRFFFCALCGE